MTSNPQSVSSTLLQRVRAREDEAWNVLVDLYAPVVYGWVRRARVAAGDAPDVVQDVFVAVARKVGDFRRSGPGGTFRGWLYTICRNKVRDHFRRLADSERATGGSTALQLLQQLPQTPPPVDSAAGRREVRDLRHRALAGLRDQFDADAWQAFWRTAVEGDAPKDVAGDLGRTVWFVYKARSRVAHRLRQQLGDLFEELAAPG